MNLDELICNLSPEKLICFIKFFIILIVIIFIITIMNLILILGLRSNSLFIFNVLKDLKADVNNVITGSKRVEKMCDAINQRTKAHLVQPKKSVVPSSNSKKINKGNGGGSKRSNKNYRGKPNEKNQKRSSDSHITIAIDE